MIRLLKIFLRISLSIQVLCKMALFTLVTTEPSVTEISLLSIHLQGDRLNMVVFLWYLAKIDFSSVYMYISVHGHVTFIKYSKDTAMFNWSPCTFLRESSSHK